MGPLGQGVGKQIQNSLSENLALIGFVDDGYEGRDRGSPLGKVADLKTLIGTYRVTDVVIALPYSAYHSMGDIITRLDAGLARR